MRHISDIFIAFICMEEADLPGGFLPEGKQGHTIPPQKLCQTVATVMPKRTPMHQRGGSPRGWQERSCLLCGVLKGGPGGDEGASRLLRRGRGQGQTAQLSARGRPAARNGSRAGTAPQQILPKSPLPCPPTRPRHSPFSWYSKRLSKVPLQVTLSLFRHWKGLSPLPGTFPRLEREGMF